MTSLAGRGQTRRFGRCRLLATAEFGARSKKLSGFPPRALAPSLTGDSNARDGARQRGWRIESCGGCAAGSARYPSGLEQPGSHAVWAMTDRRMHVSM